MRKIIDILTAAMLVTAALAFVGCRGPRIVPDKELAAIFHDVFLVNTYVGQSGLSIDSLNIYEPVFEAHGYTIEDIQYTIGNFAKRKSSRLSDDVVGVASELLRRESASLDDGRRLRDTLALLARKATARRVRFVPLIEVRRTADTARLMVVVDSLRVGDYEVSYAYTVDSLDRNAPLRVEMWMEDSLAHRSVTQSRTLGRGQSERDVRTLAATARDRRLVIDLNGYGKGMTTPRLRVDSLEVRYMMPAREAMDAFSASTWIGTARVPAYLSLRDGVPGGR